MELLNVCTVTFSIHFVHDVTLTAPIVDSLLRQANDVSCAKGIKKIGTNTHYTQYPEKNETGE